MNTMSKDARGFGRRVLENLADPSGELPALRDENAELRAELDRVRADLAANEHHEDTRLSIAEATIERLTGPEARERLARHLYIAARGRGPEDREFAASIWDADTSAGLRNAWRVRADEALAVIASKEG